MTEGLTGGSPPSILLQGQVTVPIIQLTFWRKMMKAMLKNKFVKLAVLSLLVMFSGAACANDTQKDSAVEEGNKMVDDAVMKKDGVVEEGTKAKEDAVMQKDGVIEKGVKIKDDTILMKDGAVEEGTKIKEEVILLKDDVMK